MSSAYGYVLEASAAEFLLRLDEPDARHLLANVRWLASNPHEPGADEHRDGSGRLVQAHLIGHYTVITWADHAVRELRVVEIYPE
ncbi:MAG: hypothetical protein ABII82_05005 [Verrucomicrobiota bacterium]